MLISYFVDSPFFGRIHLLDYVEVTTTAVLLHLVGRTYPRFINIHVRVVLMNTDVLVLKIGISIINRHHEICKAFYHFYHRHLDLVVNYYVGLELFCNTTY